MRSKRTIGWKVLGPNNMPTKLDYFLNGNPKSASETERKGRKVSKGEPFTHRNFDNMQGWYINSDDMDEFYKLYCDDIRRCVTRYITEKQTPIGQLRVDLDFKYVGEIEQHRHTQQQVMAFVKAYMEEIKKFLQVPEAVEIFVLEKDYPTYDPAHKISSSGIHIQIPSLKTRPEVEQKVRFSLLKRMEEFFPNLGCNKDWKDVYDAQPLSHTNNWFLLGSKKNGDGSLPYEIQYAIDWDSETGEMSIDTSVAHQPITIDLVKKFSTRSSKEEETPLTPEAERTIRSLSETSGETRSVSRGRNPPGNAPDSRSSSPGRIGYRELDPDYKDYIKQHVRNLGANRYDGGHNDWFEVCQCLSNIHPDLKDVFDDFINQTEHQDRIRKAEAAWYGCNMRVDGPKLGIRSLRYWSRMDNPVQYSEIENNHVAKLAQNAAETATENDVAQVIFARYRDEFKCASYKNNEWYRYADHIWRPTENGIELLAKLSSEVAKMFHTKELDQDRIIQEIGDQCTHTKDKPDLDGCAGCRAELYKKKYYTIRLKLKTTSFKENVMKECKLLFFDKEFAMKLDENKNLIGFKNGVYDCLTQKFRDGTAEDCVSMCTNLEYNEKLKYYDHTCWPEVRKFLESILPIENVREYFVKHLSRCLSGVYTQDFHILTGEGSNGKSMLLNLMMTCFGEYAYKVNIALFTQKRGRAGAASPELVRMKGKRFVMMSEPDQDDSLTDGFLKEVTGSEKIPCRDLYGGSKQMMEMEVQAKFHMACNVKPKVTDTTNGTWRRLKVIQFRSKFVHNPVGEHEYPIDETIMQKVQSVEWAECFMSYLIHLYTEGHGHTKLAPPTEVEQYINEYKGESDVIARFLSDYVHLIDKTTVEDPGMPAYPEPVSWSTIANTFQTWKRENEVGNRGSATELKKRLVEAYDPMPRGGWTSFRFGPS